MLDFDNAVYRRPIKILR